MKRNIQGFAHMAVIAVVLVLAVAAGAGWYVYDNRQKDQLNSENAESELSLTDALPDDLLGVDKIKELAVSENPSSAITSIELENDGGVLVYKVKLADGTVMTINAQTGSVVSTDKESEPESEDELDISTTPSVTFDRARELALAQKPGGTITKMELEQDGNKLVYKVRFSDEARIDIDATSGAVVKTEPAKSSDDSDDSSDDSNDDSDSDDDSDDSSDSDDDDTDDDN